MGDSVVSYWGTGGDLAIHHDGSNSYIQETGTGLLYIDGTQIIVRNSLGTEDIAKFIENGAVNLYYDNSNKLETTSSGVTVSGTVTDDNGNVRSLPYTSKSSAHTLIASDAGKVIYISTGGVTLPNSVMSGGDMITIITVPYTHLTLPTKA